MSKNAFTPIICKCASSPGSAAADPSAVIRSSSSCRGAIPSLFTVAVSMQLAYSSPIFCSFAHFAAILLEKGYVRDYRQAFDDYLDESARGYVYRQEPTFAEGVAVVRQAGGI